MRKRRPLNQVYKIFSNTQFQGQVIKSVKIIFLSRLLQSLYSVIINLPLFSLATILYSSPLRPELFSSMNPCLQFIRLNILVSARVDPLHSSQFSRTSQPCHNWHITIQYSRSPIIFVCFHLQILSLVIIVLFYIVLYNYTETAIIFKLTVLLDGVLCSYSRLEYSNFTIHSFVFQRQWMLCR